MTVTTAIRIDLRQRRMRLMSHMPTTKSGLIANIKFGNDIDPMTRLNMQMQTKSQRKNRENRRQNHQTTSGRQAT